MSDGEFSLFDLDEAPPQLLVDPPIRPEQVQQIVQAFTDAGIIDEASQKDIVHSCIVRRVNRLEELLAKDARPILKRIAERGTSRPQQGSAWDNRTEDTWIDKL